MKKGKMENDAKWEKWKKEKMESCIFVVSSLFLSNVN